jgi:hypothetical protein
MRLLCNVHCAKPHDKLRVLWVYLYSFWWNTTELGAIPCIEPLTNHDLHHFDVITWLLHNRCVAMAVMLPKKRPFPTLAPPAQCRINNRQLPKHSTASMQGSNRSLIGKQKPHGSTCGFAQCTKAACSSCGFCTNSLLWNGVAPSAEHGFYAESKGRAAHHCSGQEQSCPPHVRSTANSGICCLIYALDPNNR